MAAHNKTLTLIASKLGLGDEEKVLRKAAEYERLLQTKSVAGSNMTDTSKVVICLDLAACIFGVDLDIKTAIKYSGLKGPTYTNCRKVVENLLEINSDKLSIYGLCAILQCGSVQELAENILAEYQKQAKMEIDLNIPQYVCMAVHQACRISKVKVPKSKLSEKSRLKPSQWAKLEAEWTKFVDEKFAAAKKKRGRPAKNTIVADESEKMEIENTNKEEISQEPQIETYEDWKNRMLETAYKELKELEAQKQEKIKKQKKEVEKMEEGTLLSPTRARKNSHLLSPRKNNQLLSPTKNNQTLSPRKNNQTLSPKKNSQLSPNTKMNLHLKSPKVKLTFLTTKHIQQLSSPRASQRLSPAKNAQNSSPGKNTGILSPINNGQFLSPTRNSPCVTPRKDTPFLSPTQDDMSPRRSPRKTPQKFSPYKTPTSKNGVRLLFPRN